EDIAVLETALVGASLGEHREVWRIGAAVRGARSLLVREGRRPAVRQAAGTFEHLAVLARTVLNLIFGGQHLHLALGKFRTTRLPEVADRHQLHAVARGADLPIDLETALELRAVVVTEQTPEAPVELRRNSAAFSPKRGSGGQGRKGHG